MLVLRRCRRPPTVPRLVRVTSLLSLSPWYNLQVFEIGTLPLDTMPYTPPPSLVMNIKRASNLHRILNLSSKITKPRVDLTRGFYTACASGVKTVRDSVWLWRFKGARVGLSQKRSFLRRIVVLPNKEGTKR